MKTQLFGSVELDNATEIEKEATLAHNTMNSFVGFLIKKGFDVYKKEKTNG